MFNTDNDTEGWSVFGGGSLTVNTGSLTYTYGSSSNGFQLNPPSESIYVNKSDYPYLAIKLLATPTIRRYMYCKVAGTGAWYLGKGNPIGDEDLDALNVFFYDLSDNSSLSVPEGEIERLIFNLETDNGSTAVDVDWIKTFASIADIKAYADITTNLGDLTPKTSAIILSGDNRIKISQCELNAKVSVFEISGNMIYNNEVSSNELSIPCKRGVYVVKISTNKGSVTEKVVVQ